MPVRFPAALALACATSSLAAQAPAPPTDLASSAEQQLPALTEVYKHLHRNPELSQHEERLQPFWLPICASWVTR